MAREDMIPVKSGEFGTRWEIVAVEKTGMKFTKDSPDNYKEGYYTAVNEMTSKDGPFKIHSIQTVNKDGTLGELFSISGGKVLDDKMAELKLNTFIGVEYMGRQYKKGFVDQKGWTQTNSYHIWFVGQMPTAPTYEQAIATSTAKGGSAGTPVVKENVANGPATAAAVNVATPGGGHATDDDLPF